jgi:uncharacterized membrane protein
MKNFWNFFNPNARSRLVWIIVILALLGLADSAYLTVTHYVGEAISCSVIKGCEQVLTSKYSTIMNVPVAGFGVVYYSALFLAAYYNLLGSKRAWSALQVIIAVGVAVTLVLLYLQLAVIHAICQFCMISALLTTLIALLVIIRSIRNKTYDEAK